MDTLFGGGEGAGYKDMEDQIRQAMQQYGQQEAGAEQELDPYAQAGKRALGKTESYLDQLSDPEGYINKVMGDYKMSPQAKFEMEQGITAANRGAAAGGMLGSGAEQKALEEYGQKLTSRDMQQYFENVTGVGKTYLGGEGGLVQTGERGAEDIGSYKMTLADAIAQLRGSMARAQMGGERARSKGITGTISALFGSDILDPSAAAKDAGSAAQVGAFML